MKRGPHMPVGLSLAIPLGFLRGHVMAFLPAARNLAEFQIVGNGWFVLVSVRPVGKLHMTMAEIEAEIRDVIAGLRLVPAGGPVSCELWLYSRYGTFRHFRIERERLVEINAYGLPLGEPAPARAGTAEGGNGTNGPDQTPLPADRQPVPGAPKNHILRWLAKWNAARAAGRTTLTMDEDPVKKALDAGGPAVKTKRTSRKKPAGPKKTGTGKPGAEKANPAGEKSIGSGTGSGPGLPESPPVPEPPASPGPAPVPLQPGTPGPQPVMPGSSHEKTPGG